LGPYDRADDPPPELPLADRELIGQPSDREVGARARLAPEPLHRRAHDGVRPICLPSAFRDPRPERPHRVGVRVEHLHQPGAVVVPHMLDAHADVAKLLGRDHQQRRRGARAEARPDHPAAGADVGDEGGRVRADELRVAIHAPDTSTQPSGRTRTGKPSPRGSQVHSSHGASAGGGACSR
jgi:hypothetical protein